MSDQADTLRQLMQAKAAEGSVVRLQGPRVAELGVADPQRSVGSIRPRPDTSTARSLVFTGSKGGVGTSTLTLNLAVALADLGERVILIDAGFERPDLDVLQGIALGSNLGNAQRGRRPLLDATVPRLTELRIVSGSQVLSSADEPARANLEQLGPKIAMLEGQADFLLFDAGTGFGPTLVALAGAADEVIVITTPEPTSVKNAHILINKLRRLPRPPVARGLVNLARSLAEGDDVLARLSATSREFLEMEVVPLGCVRDDSCVPRAVRARRSFVIDAPGSAAARGIRKLAWRLIAEKRPTRHLRPSFAVAQAARWALRRIAL